MNRFSFRAVLLVLTVSTLGMLAWGQGSHLKPGQGLPKVATTPITETGAYLLKEIQKLKKQVNELKTRLAAEELKNKSQDDNIANKEDKVNPGPDYAGGGWCTKNTFLNVLDNDKTMIHYVMVK